MPGTSILINKKLDIVQMYTYVVLQNAYIFWRTSNHISYNIYLLIYIISIEQCLFRYIIFISEKSKSISQQVHFCVMFCILTLQVEFKTKNIHAVSYTFKMTAGYYTMLDKFVIDLQKKLEVFPRCAGFIHRPN